MRYVVLLIIFCVIACKDNQKESSKKEEDITEDRGETDKEDISENEKINSETSFPKVKKLEEFPQSTFLPTLESSFTTNKNGIYAASILFAWDEIRKKFKGNIKNIQGTQLQEIQDSKTYQNVLSQNEYQTEISYDSTISIRAFFNKSLPFTEPFQKNHNLKFRFGNKDIASFGFSGFHENAGILYYYNDNDFAIRLFPKDEEHEIILMKNNFTLNTSLSKEVERLESLVNKFKQEENNNNEWRYSLKPEDDVIIPIITLNIEHIYPDMTGASFLANDTLFTIGKAYQRIAFILNEQGAEVESEAILEYEPDEEEPIEIPQPKKLYFNKPFLVLLKRKDNSNPYFAMFVANPELLEEYEERKVIIYE